MIEIRSAGEGQPDLISKGCKQVCLVSYTPTDLLWLYTILYDL